MELVATPPSGFLNFHACGFSDLQPREPHAEGFGALPSAGNFHERSVPTCVTNFLACPTPSAQFQQPHVEGFGTIPSAGKLQWRKEFGSAERLPPALLIFTQLETLVFGPRNHVSKVSGRFRSV